MPSEKSSAKVRIDYQDGILAATFDGCGMNDAITLMEAAKLKFLLQSMGGPGRPAEPGAPQGGRFRAPGLNPRRADDLG